MIKVVTAKEMQEKDRYTIEEVGIPGVVLMENAGTATFRIIQQVLADASDPTVYIFCGKGNNGGDGFVVARHLWNEGIFVKVFCAVEEDKISGDALINYTILKNMKIPIEFITHPKDLKKINKNQPDVIVDALLGTGIKGEVRGLIKDIIDFINQEMEALVVSIDLPSGLNADLPDIPGSAIRADITVTMALPKRCHVLYPARSYVGELFIADIGIPPFILNKDDVKVSILEDEDIVLPFRYEDAHKYECGKVAVLAGSRGYTGAAALTASAALKIGSGLVILGIPESMNSVMEQKLTEVITRPLPEEDEQTIGLKSLDEINDLLEWCDVLAIGPGLGRTEEVQHTVIKILRNLNKPAVIDADALFALANYPNILKEAPHPHWILTPHLGEFRRFFPSVSKEELSSQRVELAQQFATNFQLVLVLKGAPSLVALPDGQILINSTGNSGLASGGTGDVLTGFIAGLAAQGLSPEEAAYTGNYIHGLAADFVAERETKYSLIAGELIENLGPVLNRFLNQEEK
ncbi:MAG: NAD(P)H-hydrate dehydratase [Calditrichaeota bacterium]|nr:MAG: NAD(P)H-hydrate dehydratase [Calditrichota bacterium]